MKPAVFFQKYGEKIIVKVIRRIYSKFFLITNKQRVKFLRDSGAKIGDNLTINNINTFGSEPWLIEVGNDVYFSGGETQLLTHDGGIPWTYKMGIAQKPKDVFGKIKIGNACFIGTKSLILKGVTIGDNCVVGAGSIVTKDVPSGSVVCGVPAKVIGTTEEYYNKNKENLDDTFEWNRYKKRLYLEEKYLNRD